MKFFITISAIVLALNASGSLSAVVPSDQNANSIPPSANKPPGTSIIEAMNLATSVTFKALAKENPGNLVMSALGLVALATPNYFASAAASQNSINETLRFAFNLDGAKQELGQLFANIDKHANAETTFGNVIYYPSGEKNVTAQFLNILENSKLPIPQAVNFENHQEVADKFNEVIAQSTKGNINNLLQVDDLQRAKIIQGNAGYIQENFQQKFILLPQREIFKNKQNSEELLQYIAQAGDFKYGRIETYASVVQIPLENKAVELNIIVPDTIGDYEAFEKVLLSKIDFPEVLTEKSPAIVKLPVINITSYLNLSQTVQQMGFGPVWKNSVILENTELDVVEIIQKALLNITPKGLNISFGSVAVSQEQTNKLQNPSSSQAYQLDPSVFSKVDAAPAHETLNVFVVNKPFLVTIVEKKSQGIVFYGCVENVSQEAPSYNNNNNNNNNNHNNDNNAGPSN